MQDEFISAPIEAGGCTLHHGRTLHYSRGNNTSSTRRGFILNFRPKAMVKEERERGFDHGLKVNRFHFIKRFIKVCLNIFELKIKCILNFTYL